MKELLARQLLAKVMDFGDDLDDMAEVVDRLTTLSEIKYDDYGGYSPGVKFIESLAMWLTGFESEDRRTALDFVLKRLTYVSAAELDHLVATVYKDVLRPLYMKRAASLLGEPEWAVRKIRDSNAFKSLQRRTLVLGLSDGARLDKLRRYSALSTEQFHLVSVLDTEKQSDMSVKLAKALAKMGLEAARTFNSVIVVDDFSGSGTTMLRYDEDDHLWRGKLQKLQNHLADLKDNGVVADDATVIVILYLISDNADRELRARIKKAGFESEIRLFSAHKFAADFPLDTSDHDDNAFLELCMKYFRPTWKDEHNALAGDVTYGYGGSALPLVLHHNAPNNSPPIVWKDEAADGAVGDPSKDWMGVFPRYERHHPGRP
ncbi:hypothetical protein [Frigoribacterium sp. PhB116]|uniref:phosphoribosyltransferase-like protein n=1 Tax=Frigoribacterium sp. PhB116 TaxID=2485174 RepID=UPI00105C24C6|nr:hypothetical protein [Frigoribacterium sp. PhB116]TDT65257.1 hypothetical protein EDF20_0036 [Frigoribacterium sp. PhB116]